MPDWARELREAIAPLSLDPAREAEVVEELGQDLRDRYEEMQMQGISEPEAANALRRELTDGTLLSGLKATLRNARAIQPLEETNASPIAGVWNDFRYAARLLRKSPGFAMVAIVSLALGIGANTTIFQLLDAVRLRTVPVRAPQQLAIIRIVNSPKCCSGNHYATNAALTGPLWNLVRKQQEGFSDLAVWAPDKFNLSQGGEARYADGLMVSGGFFQMLGVQPALGRLISPADDYHGCGAQGVALSYAFWQREFGGRAEAIGSKLTLNGHPFQVIGVAAASFYGLEVGQKFDVALALCSQPVFSSKAPLMDDPLAWWLAPVGRLKPGWTVARASAQLDAISSGIFAATVPAPYDAIGKKDYLSFHLGALPGATGIYGVRSQYEDPLLLLLVLAALVLLIACANLANLMLARAGVRQREMALRLTLGASRARLVRQMLAESLLLAVLGTVAGALLAQLLSKVLVAFLSTQRNPIFLELSPDWRVLGFAALLAALTCVLFGVAPAMQASRTDPGVVMKAGGRGSTAGRDRLLLRRALVVSQVALSLVLLTGALLFVRSFRNLMTVDTGFQQEHLLVTEIDFSALKMAQDNRMAFKRSLIDRMRAVSGISSAAETLVVPISNSGWDDNTDIVGGPQRVDLTYNRVSEGYFETMQIPLLAGRDFARTDTPASPMVVIVNEAFARKFAVGASPLGMLVRDAERHITYQVVGLVKDTKYYRLRENPEPILYVSFTQANGPEETSTLVIRSSEPLQPLIDSIKRAAHEIDPGLVLEFTVLKTQISESLMRERLMATLSGFFGVLAAVLAMVGLYGVVSYMVTRRRNEIGIRMALGATREGILLMVLREAATLVGIGLAVGAVLALVAGTAASSLLYGLKPADPLTLCSAVAGLSLAALVASLLPAQRAASVQPMTTLREE